MIKNDFNLMRTSFSIISNQANMKIFVCLLGAMICILLCSYGQVDSTLGRLAGLSNKLFSKITSSTSKLNDDLTKQSQKYLKRLELKEKKLQQKLYKRDSISAKYLFAGDPQKQYASFIKKMQSDSTAGGLRSPDNEQYLPYVDSMKVSLDFLKANPQFLNNSAQGIIDLQSSISQLKTLQNKLNYSYQLKAYVTARKEQIRQYLLQQTHLPASITNLYKEYNAGLYNYSAQIQSYKETLNDPDKLLKAALGVLDKLPAFQSFLKTNSYLASLFPMPANFGTPLALNGLQSHSNLQEILQGRIPSTASASNALSQSMDNAKSDLDQLKDRITKYGQGGQAIDDPNFRPNTEATKSLFRRLEYETNFQSQPTSNYIPSYSDIGLGICYKLNSSNVIGIAFSYRLGFGRPLKNIQMSSQGIGLRSYLDIKLKGSIYFSGGFEYDQNVFVVPSQMQSIKIWDPVGLLGFSKIISVKSKVIKKSKIQILWNYLSYYQIPRSQPVIIRFGYGF